MLLDTEADSGEFKSATCRGLKAAGCAAAVSPTHFLQLVREIVRVRRQRARFFPGRLFADPAWEILLELTLADQQQLRLTISRLCARVDVPTTTALRWIATMTEDGFLVRRDDPTDRRRKYIELSPAGRAGMLEYCASIAMSHRLAA